MAEVTYTFRRAAQRAIDRKREELLRQRRLGLVSSAYVQREFLDFMRYQMESARIVAEGNEMIGVRCPDCAREHIMPASIHHYRCTCTPHTDRATVHHRFVLA